MFNENLVCLYLLSQLEISINKQEQLLDVNNGKLSINNLFKNSSHILSELEVNALEREYNSTNVEAILKNMEENGVKFLTPADKDYPQAMLPLPEHPQLLYAKGDLSLLKEPCLAIVGTRYPTSYGKLVTEKFAKKLAENGIVIVSGLCFGIDEIAHRATLEVDGKTIAVIAGGFNNIYPATNTNLAKEISQKGLLFSEYPPSFVAKKYTFPKRNRIVAGISKGVLITEATLKSGTMHTKEYALEYGKELFSIPGNILNEKSELPNHIIQTSQAQCVCKPEDILEVFGIQAKVPKQKVLSLSFDEKTILELLKDEERSFEYLASNSKIPVNILNSCLTTLEIRGLIRKLPAQMFTLIR